MKDFDYKSAGLFSSIIFLIFMSLGIHDHYTKVVCLSKKKVIDIGGCSKNTCPVRYEDGSIGTQWLPLKDEYYCMEKATVWR